jgi:hypothetical protein
MPIHTIATRAGNANNVSANRQERHEHTVVREKCIGTRLPTALSDGSVAP